MRAVRNVPAYLSMASEVKSMAGFSADIVEAFGMPAFARLTYQEYSHRAHGKSVDQWLCENYGL